MPTDLWKAVNYKTPIKYLINTYIREYDLSKANINSLLYTGTISQDQYKEFLAMDKKTREVRIGLMEKRDTSIYKKIQVGVIEAKRRLVYENEIEDFNVVSVKNDAMFISGDLLSKTEFPPFKFNIKNEYIMYFQLQELEVYYGDSDDSMVNIDIKGIDDNILPKHTNGMLDLICSLCYKLQRENISDTMQWMWNMYDNFINRNLPKEYYRSFDSVSMYTIRTMTTSYLTDDIDESYKNALDINRNLLIFRDLMFIVSDIYRGSMRSYG